MKALELAETMEYALKYQQEQGRRIMELERTVPLAAAELRRLAEVNAELLEALEKTVQPLELYKAYGWPDRAGVIFNAKKVISKAKEQQ